MANLTATARFTISDAPATGLTLADIDFYLSRINKSTGAADAVWNPSNPDTEVGGGVYSLLYNAADFETYDYIFWAEQTGATVLDTNYAYGALGGDPLAEIAIADIAAGVTVTTVNDKTGYSLSVAGVQAIVDDLMAEVLESGKTFKTFMLDLWAVIVGGGVADDADEPTQIEYDSPDGTVQVTHTLTDTTRSQS